MEADISVLGAAVHALGIVFDPLRFGFLALGVVIGLFLGVIPGLGGILGLSLLLPFTFSMDAYAAVAMMLGLLAATSCSDSIPSVLLGVPGSVGAAATILDGHPMAKQGLAGRALGASFFSSMMGGIIGALCLALLIPIMRPVVLGVGTPELLAICVLGLSLVAILSTGMMLKGLAAAAMGILISTTGVDANTGISRWTFDSLYLFDGIEVILVALGLFALPELADMFASGAKQIAQKAAPATRFSQLEGARDVMRNKALLIRSSLLGVGLASVPGIGAAVIDWIAYGYAKRMAKNSDGFGKGDVRGIIAAESSNSAKDGGHLVPTIAFGVPGGPPMALILGAFLVHNITPGPEMLSTRLDVTYTLVWTVALANVLGTALCFLFANQFAKIAQIRIGIVVPLILSIIFIGAFQASQEWGDFYVLFGFGLLGWIMKRAGWPRPPLILGFVLGALIENYMFISFERYGGNWVFRPIVVVILCLSFGGLMLALWSAFKAQRKNAVKGKLTFVRPTLPTLVTIGGAVIFAAALIVSSDWPTRSQLVPQIICWAGLIACVLQLVSESLGKTKEASIVLANVELPADEEPEITVSDKVFLTRSAMYGGWCLGFLAAAALVGLLPAVFFFLFAFIRLQAREKSLLALMVAAGCTFFMWLLFQEIIHVHWPFSLLGMEFPWLRETFGIF